MHTFILKNKKILVLPLLVVMLFFSVSIPRASAVPGAEVPTGDSTSWLTTIGQFAAKITADIALQASKITLESVAYIAGQLVLDQVTNNIVSWAQGGFNGSPSFAVDPNKLMMDTANAVSGGMVKQLTNLTVCNFDGSDSTRTNLQKSVTQSSRKVASNSFTDQIKCPFTGNQAQKFYTDFADGGWNSFKKSLSDKGNPFGVAVKTSQELAARTEEVTKIQTQKLTQSGGFLDMVDKNNCPSMPKEVQDAMDLKAYAKSAGNTEEELMNQGYLPEDAIASYQQSYCKTMTPGKMVSDRLGKATGIDMDRLGFVDSMSKITRAVMQGMTKVAMDGVFSSKSMGTAATASTAAVKGTLGSYGGGSAYVQSDAAAKFSPVSIGATPGVTAQFINVGQEEQFMANSTCRSSSDCAAFTLTATKNGGILKSITVTADVGTDTDSIKPDTELSNLSLAYNTNGNGGDTTHYGLQAKFTNGAAKVRGNLALVLVAGKTYYFYVKVAAKGPGNSTTVPHINKSLGFMIAGDADVEITGVGNPTGAPQYLAGNTITTITR